MAMNGIVASASTANEPSVPGMLHFEIACAPPTSSSLNHMQPLFITRYFITSFYNHLYNEDQLTNIPDQPAPVTAATSETPKGKSGKKPKKKSLVRNVSSD